MHKHLNHLPHRKCVLAQGHLTLKGRHLTGPVQKKPDKVHSETLPTSQKLQMNAEVYRAMQEKLGVEIMLIDKHSLLLVNES